MKIMSLDLDNYESDVYETNTLVFMLKIWAEEKSGQKTKAKWRGYITHIPSATRQHFDTLDGMIEFILSYMEQIGVQPRFSWRAITWLLRLKKLPRW